jgi:hypothetical protein
MKKRKIIRITPSVFCDIACVGANEYGQHGLGHYFVNADKLGVELANPPRVRYAKKKSRRVQRS